MIRLRNRGQFFILAASLLVGMAFLSMGVSSHVVRAEAIQVAQKKKSTRKSSTIRTATPKIDSITSITNGYKIEGSGFGTNKSNIQVYEGRSRIPSSSIVNVTDNSIEISRKPQQKVVVRVSRGNLSSNTHEFQWVDPALALRKTEQISNLKKTGDLQQMVSQEQKTKAKTGAPTIQPLTKVEQTKKGEQVTGKTTIPSQLKIPSKKTPTTDGGLHPIGRPPAEEPGGSQEGGNTMQALMNRDDANCSVCHNVILGSDPFWTWQAQEGDTTVRYITRKKWFPNPPELLTQLPPAFHHAETDPGRFPPITTNNANIVGIGPAADTDTELRHRIVIGERGTTTINWGGSTRTITVSAGPVSATPGTPATGIQSFTIQPNSVEGGNSATATVILNGTLEFGGRIQWQQTYPGVQGQPGYPSSQIVQIPQGGNQTSWQISPSEVDSPVTLNFYARATRYVNQYGSGAIAPLGEDSYADLNVTAGGAPVGGSTFSQTIASAFGNARCVNCHGYNASNSTKPGHNVGSTCTNCHIPGWRAPASTLDFRNKSQQQLCNMAKTGSPPHPNFRDHLKEDTLILWAVANGNLPQNNSVTPIFGNAQTWTNLVDAWDGESCN